MRRVDRFVALALALALAGAGILAGIETMLLVLGRPPLVIPRHQWDQDLRTTRWDSDAAVIASATLLTLGAVLLLLQVVRRRPIRLPGAWDTTRALWVSRQGLARRLAWDLQQFDPVSATRVRVGRRRVSVRVRAGAGTDRAALLETARAAAQGSVDALGVGGLGLRQRPEARRELQWKLRVDLEPIPADATTTRHGRRRRT